MDSLQIKKEIYNILCVFDSFCKKHDIKYMLGYGTLLGAIRHKGFIPWDDDIDVVLTTDEYFKLREAAKRCPFLDEGERYRFLLPGDRNYCYSYIKVVDQKYRVKEKNIADAYNLGLYIDVFRVDYWPENRLSETFQLKRARFLNKLTQVLVRGNIEAGSRYEKLDKLLRPLDFILNVAGVKPEKICAVLEKKGRKNRKSPYMGNIMSGSGRRSERMQTVFFNEYTTVAFEEGFFPAPEKYEGYLKQLYGDYMKIPDKSKQIGHEYNIEIV